jgi:hypothetical protein
MGVIKVHLADHIGKGTWRPVLTILTEKLWWASNMETNPWTPITLRLSVYPWDRLDLIWRSQLDCTSPYICKLTVSVLSKHDRYPRCERSLVLSYSPFWDPRGISEKVLASNPVECRWKLCLPCANELDLGVNGLADWVCCCSPGKKRK